MSSLSSHSLVAKEAGYNAITEASISNCRQLELVQSSQCEFYPPSGQLEGAGGRIPPSSCLKDPHVCYTCSGLFSVLPFWGKTHAADCKWCIDCVQWQEWHGDRGVAKATLCSNSFTLFIPFQRQLTSLLPLPQMPTLLLVYFAKYSCKCFAK